MNTKPFNNNVLIEIIREDDGVSRTDENETRNRGSVVAVSVSNYHITASAALQVDKGYMKCVIDMLVPGTIVRWEEFAEGGQTFEENGKTYALVPWWRIISIEETK